MPNVLNRSTTLGLAKSYGSSGFVPLYLWYRVPSLETAEHSKEIGEFAERIEGDFTFQSMTYQELFNIVRELFEVESPYIEYLGARHFP